MRKLPAEWEKHGATWIAWPVNTDNWPGKMGAVCWAFAEMARLISRSEKVYIACPTQESIPEIITLLKDNSCDMKAIELVHIPTSYGWFRDCGPQFVKNDGVGEILDFNFNAWAKYSDYQMDDKVAQACAAHINCPISIPKHNNTRITLEGGAIDVNGSGTILSTRECMLDTKVQVRNPGFTQQDYEDLFKEYFGATNTIWLNCGITGDDTHGHVDDLARFVNRNTIVTIREHDTSDINYKALEENFELLSAAVLEDGSKPELVQLPMPEGKYYRGDRLPASYANFYITNDSVLVPTFNDPNDYKALGILAELFTDRKVCGVHAIDLVVGRGSIHCLTRQQPETVR